MIAAEFENEIHEIRELYNTAEADLKNVGRIKDALIVTGVNQCRYVGQHLLRALVSTDRTEVKENLDAAKRHAQRAIYDINDSAIQYYVRQIDDLRNKHFPTVDFASVIPKYGEIIEAVVQAKSLVEANRDSLKNREKFYESTKAAVTSLHQSYMTFLEFRPELARAARRENTKQLVAWIAVGVAALSTAITVIVATLRFGLLNG